MDLRAYYQKIKEWEAKIEQEFPVVKSNDTADGGKTGTLTEVTKQIAAKLIVDGIAQLAGPAEVEKFKTAIAKAKQVADAASAAAAALQLTLVPKQELDTLRANQTSGTKE